MTAPRRRLGALAAHLDRSERIRSEPAAGLLERIRGLWAGGDDTSESETEKPPTGVVKNCYVADEGWPGHEAQADPRFSGHYLREHVDSIYVEVTPEMECVPPSHRAMAVGLRDPNERALMMSTSEGYETLRAALPHAAATLSHERPGSGENFFVEGLAQGELCIGDVFEVEGRSTRLEVSSPRR
jgi:hypothetical protein